MRPLAPRHRHALAASLSWLAACVADEGSPSCEVGALDEPTCATRPALCAGEVWRDLRADRPEHAVDLVFVSEGFDDDELAGFRRRVADWLAALDGDATTIVGRDPARFNRYAVSLPTRGDPTDDVLSDTPLRGCLRRDALVGGGTPMLTAHPILARFAARAHVPEADIVVVVMNTDRGRANAPVMLEPGTEVGVVVVRRDVSARTLDHELGHALVHLGDEYEEVDACFDADPAPSALPRSEGDWALALTPNLTVDPRGARWAAWTAGAVEGGARYRRCVYHPTARCRMRDDLGDDPFCPVCNAAIDRVLRRYREGVETRRPVCALVTSAELLARAGYLVCPYARGYDGATRYTISDAGGRVLRSGVDAPRPAPTGPSLGDHTGCVTVRWADAPPGDVTLRIDCWSPSGETAANTLTLRRP